MIVETKSRLSLETKTKFSLLEPASLMAEVLETEQMLEERRGCT